MIGTWQGQIYHGYWIPKVGCGVPIVEPYLGWEGYPDYAWIWWWLW